MVVHQDLVVMVDLEVEAAGARQPLEVRETEIHHHSLQFKDIMVEVQWGEVDLLKIVLLVAVELVALDLTANQLLQMEMEDLEDLEQQILMQMVHPQLMPVEVVVEQ
jgi:hypothetical protein